MVPMSRPAQKRNLVVSIALIGLGLGLCGWQFEEHQRFQRNAAQALINRGRDITSTLGVVVRSQRRNGIVVPKERLQAALQDLIRPEELDSIAILSATGETIASAGQPTELTPEMLHARGVFWRDESVTILNLMDLDSTVMEDGARSPAAIVATSDRISRAFRPPLRRPSETRPASDPPSTIPGESSVAIPPTAAAATANAPAPTLPTDTPAVASGPTAAATSRPVFSRPSWMPKAEYDSIIQKQGVHSLVLSMSTLEMQRSVQSDLVLRSLVSLLALGGSVLSVFAWRNFSKSSELQLRLVRAGEANTHLKEMNFAAAGLAHETRNPLNLIRGLAQMIAMEAQASPKLKEHASTIIEEADRVTVQLNEFINYSKPREAHLAPVEVKRLVADVARTLVPDIEEKRITLRQPEAPMRVEADEQLLRQALFNVLLNATQAVGQGGQIEIRLNPSGPGGATIEVCDDGPGVPAAERASIFKPYVTMRPKGVGLGLAIVHQIASAHHWDVACDAHQPRGACFRFSGLKLAGPA